MEEELMLPAEIPESLTAMGGGAVLPDAELVRQAATGDHAAFTALFYQTYRFAFLTVAALLPADEDRRDVLQEVYTRVYTGLPRLREPEAFLGWLKAIARNCALSQRQKNNLDLLSAALYMGDEEEMFLAKEEPRETAMDIRAVLESLPPEQARLLVLVYYDGLKLSEIARLQGVPASTVRSRFAVAKRALTEALKGRGIDRTVYGRGGFFSAVATSLRDAIGTDVLSAAVAQDILNEVLKGSKPAPIGYVAAKFSRRRRNAAVLRIAALVVALSLAASAVMVAVMTRRDTLPVAQSTPSTTTTDETAHTTTTASSEGEAVVPSLATTTTKTGTTPTTVPPVYSTDGSKDHTTTLPVPGSTTESGGSDTTVPTLLTAGATTTTTLPESPQTTCTTQNLPPITKRTTTTTKPTTTHTTKTITTGTAKPASTTAKPTTTTKRTTTTVPTTTTTTMAPIVVPEVFVPDYRSGHANVLGNNAVNLENWQAFIAEQDGWLYFFTESNRLMKRNIETGQTTPIYQAPTGDSIRALNAVGDWLYFANENKGIMRIHTDGSGLEQLSSLSVTWVLVRREELFYRHNSNLYVMDISTRKASAVEYNIASVHVCEDVVYYEKRVDEYGGRDLYQWTKAKGSELISTTADYFLANGNTTVYYRTAKGLVARDQDGQERLYPWKPLEKLIGSIWEYGDWLVALEGPGEIQQMSLSDGVLSNIMYIARYTNVQPSYAAGLESGLYWRQDGVVYRCRRSALSFYNYEVFWKS